MLYFSVFVPLQAQTGYCPETIPGKKNAVCARHVSRRLTLPVT